MHFEKRILIFNFALIAFHSYVYFNPTTEHGQVLPRYDSNDNITRSHYLQVIPSKQSNRSQLITLTSLTCTRMYAKEEEREIHCMVFLLISPASLPCCTTQQPTFQSSSSSGESPTFCRLLFRLSTVACQSVQ